MEECCLYSLDLYTQRVVDNLGLEVCDDGCHNKFIPAYHCHGEASTLGELEAAIVEKSEEECGCYKPKGECTEEKGFPAKCRGSFGTDDPTQHRRRQCKSTTTTVTTTTPEPTTTVTTTTETTTVTTTTPETTTV